MVLAALALVAGDPAARSAVAHPEGMPAHARLQADGPTVTISLSIAPDDAALIGERLGFLPEGAEDWYLDRTREEGQPTAAQVREFSRSPQLRTYLLDRIEVRQDGVACDGQVEPPPNVIREGAQLIFRCPVPVTAVDLRITLLHDEDEVYRTISLAGTMDSHAHTAAEPEHRWEFDTAAAPRAGVPVALPVGLAGVVVGGVGLVLRGPWRTRRRA